MSDLAPGLDLLDVLAAMPDPTDSAACSCWTAPPSGFWIHGGHCCFDGPPEAYAPDQPVPCGHNPKESR